MSAGGYDPFARGPLEVRTRTVELPDDVRGRVLPCEVWEPAGPPGPLVVYSHHAGGHRRVATFLTRHLAGHGYPVAAVDHSETKAIVASRVPDVRLVLDHLAPSTAGLVGHSLAAGPSWRRRTTTRGCAPSSRTRRAAAGTRSPGVPDLSLRFARPVPTLVLAADNDEPVPLDDVLDVFGRIPVQRRLAVLRAGHHQHFADDVELREGASTPPGLAHAFVRGLTLAHLDAHLRDVPAAHAVLDQLTRRQPSATARFPRPSDSARQESAGGCAPGRPP